MGETDNSAAPATGKAASRIGLVVLLGAAVLAIGTVAWRAWSPGDDAAPAAAVDPAQPLTIAELEAKARAPLPGPPASRSRPHFRFPFPDPPRFPAVPCWTHPG